MISRLSRLCKAVSLGAHRETVCGRPECASAQSPKLAARYNGCRRAEELRASLHYGDGDPDNSIVTEEIQPTDIVTRRKSKGAA